jgi:malonate transporter
MNIATLLVPDFTLILLGFLLKRYGKFTLEFWAGLEKMVYYVLFPALLFYSTSRTVIDFHVTGKLLQVTMGAITCAIALGWLAKILFQSAPMIFESAVQTAFRFNSYIALAAASRIAGEEGTALMALIVGFAVPVCNAAAVHALAHKSGGVLKEMLRNPLILATASGLVFNLAGLQYPDVAGAILSRLGNASIALGLIAVGAGLQLAGLHAAKGIAGYLLAVKLLAFPAIAYGLGRALDLPPLQLQIAVAFSAMPTASSAYVLAARMGGNGPFVAFLISASTLLSVLTLPFWLALTH